jgi:hypothetical protein
LREPGCTTPWSTGQRCQHRLQPAEDAAVLDHHPGLGQRPTGCGSSPGSLSPGAWAGPHLWRSFQTAHLQDAKLPHRLLAPRNHQKEFAFGFYASIKLKRKLRSICVKNTPISVDFWLFIIEFASHLLQCAMRWR